MICATNYVGFLVPYNFVSNLSLIIFAYEFVCIKYKQLIDMELGFVIS